MIWQMAPDTTLHAGYSRYLSPPPFELVGAKDVALFQNTSSPPLSPGAAAPLPERANYYDLGLQQRINREFTVGVDTYYKQSENLIDEGQFGAPIILTPFNYRYGQLHDQDFERIPQPGGAKRQGQTDRFGAIQFHDAGS
jgi:hypothetical protein